MRFLLQSRGTFPNSKALPLRTFVQVNHKQKSGGGAKCTGQRVSGLVQRNVYRKFCPMWRNVPPENSVLVHIFIELFALLKIAPNPASGECEKKVAYPSLILPHRFDHPQKRHQPPTPGAVIVRCDRALGWKVRGDAGCAPKKMSKRKLDAFFIFARDSTPKPQHTALSPCRAAEADTKQSGTN